MKLFEVFEYHERNIFGTPNNIIEQYARDSNIFMRVHSI